MYQNAKKYFVTSKTPGDLKQILSTCLPDSINVDTVINAGGVWLNTHRITDKTQVIKAQETLKVYVCQNQGQILSLDPKDIHSQSDDWLIVYKPPHVSSVPDRSNRFYNMTYAVEAWLKQQGSRYIPTAINRLDYAVDGLMIFAKHKAAEKHWFSLMQNRQVGKGYHAILEKRPLHYPNCLRIQDKIDFKGKAIASESGKAAHSLFLKVSEDDSTVTYRVILYTGRRHQIRFHAAKYLSPIAGDTFYGAKAQKSLSNIRLTASAYNFTYKKRRYKIRI